MRPRVVPTVNIFILQEGRVLLGRRTNTGWSDGMLCPPGGHIEPNETPIQACQRELHEELGITVDSSDLEFLAVAARKTSEGETVAYEFVIMNNAYPITNTEPDKCSELVWADPSSLPPPMLPKILGL